MGMKDEMALWYEKHASLALNVRGYRAGTVFKLRENVYGILTKAPHPGGDTWSFLVNGPEKALVVDTGFGIGDLKGVLEELSGGKELVVVNTHFHGDHTLGNVQFDKVYINEYDEPMLRANMREAYFDEFCFKIVDHSFYEDVERNHFRPYELTPIKDHHVFDLGGGYEVEAIWMPGHSAGGCCYLDRTQRILFTGDAVMNPFSTAISGPLRPNQTTPEYATVTQFRRQLVKLMRKLDEFDVIFDAHGIPETPKSRVKDTLIVCDMILDDPENPTGTVVRRNRQVDVMRLDDGAVDYCLERV